MLPGQRNKPNIQCCVHVFHYRTRLRRLKTKLQDGATSESLLEWYPSHEDDGKYLICRAENPRLSGAAIEDRWNLTVHCKRKPLRPVGFTPQITQRDKCSASFLPGYLLVGGKACAAKSEK
ncbi:hypothetical protein PV325_000482 [Microctonus aethiopoides]|nr:hypothetical protein PV325_000482 [Microctonus aethiopoides]